MAVGQFCATVCRGAIGCAKVFQSVRDADSPSLAQGAMKHHEAIGRRGAKMAGRCLIAPAIDLVGSAITR